MNREFFTVRDVVSKVLNSKKRNFLESVDAAIRFSCDEKVAGDVEFKHSFVDLKRIVVFAEGDDVLAVRDLGIEIVGGVDLINSIKSNKSLIKRVNYCVASSSLTSEVQKIAKILAMNGIMPNINNGTLTKDLVRVINLIKNGKSWFKSSKAKIIYMKIGDVNFDVDKVSDNLLCLLGAIFRTNVKIKKALSSISLSTTMGPSFFCDISSINSEVL